jgi:alpha,alpha-trehalase
MPARLNFNKVNFIQLYGDLFKDVQSSGVFDDSKTFTDSVPKYENGVILQKYTTEKFNPGFDLKKFVLENFSIPDVEEFKQKIEEKTDVTGIEDAIKRSWDVLYRENGKEHPENSTMVHLPYPYITPGGRFRELFYWDSYFTCLGLIHQGHEKLVINICDNFCYLIDQFGFIPNGNRVYFTGRSQPPVFALLIELIAEKIDQDLLKKYIPYCEKEYRYWMDGYDNFNENQNAVKKMVLVGDDEILNRYFENDTTPREEAYKVETDEAQTIREDMRTFFYQNMRAAAESGWDFSSRWFEDYKTVQKIRTTEICPVDLNSLLYLYEIKLAKWYKRIGHNKLNELYLSLAQKRKEVIQKYFWSEDKGCYFDYCWTGNYKTKCYSLATMFPLFAGISNQVQADKIAKTIKDNFLFNGGLVTSLNDSGQQWDFPNGWAPLQWIAIQGLRNYGHNILADEIKSRWLKVCTDSFNRTGYISEKYNVVLPHQEAIKGEYENQVGFGWTNGVIIALLKEKS